MGTLIEVTAIDTPIGRLQVAVREGVLCAVKFEDRWGRGVDAIARRFPEADYQHGNGSIEAASVLRRYFAGDIEAIDELAIDVDGTPFQRRVWSALRRVPAGKTATYGQIARRARYPRAIRAVGTATGANPIGIVVPCHRIVPASGGVGNYGGGADRKRWLLEHEAAHARPS